MPDGRASWASAAAWTRTPRRDSERADQRGDEQHRSSPHRAEVLPMVGTLQTSTGPRWPSKGLSRRPRGHAPAPRARRSRARTEGRAARAARAAPASRATACPRRGARRRARSARPRRRVRAVLEARAASRCGRGRRRGRPARRAALVPARALRARSRGVAAARRGTGRTLADVVAVRRTDRRRARGRASGSRPSSAAPRRAGPRPRLRPPVGRAGRSARSRRRTRRQVEVTSGSQSKPSRQAGCTTRQIQRPGRDVSNLSHLAARRSRTR